ncbi:unnamed protein product [Choristocarpus tenellus]
MKLGETTNSPQCEEGRGVDSEPSRADYVCYRDGESCAICLVGKAGCPLCWEFPEGWEPRDFAYHGPHKKRHASKSSRQGWQCDALRYFKVQSHLTR